MHKIYKTTFFLVFVAVTTIGTAQVTSLKIGNNPTIISNSAVLELESTTKGLLLPRMTTAQRDAISTPVVGLIFYNIDTNAIEVNTGTPATPTWTAASGGGGGGGGGAGWNLTGNAGASSTTNFIGTTDAQDLVLRTNNTEQVRVLTDGKLGIGTATPAHKLALAGTTVADRTISISTTPVVYLPTQGTATGQFDGSIAIGDGLRSLSNTTSIDGRNNTAVGIGALTANTTGNQNTASGNNSLKATTTGTGNTASGYNALTANTTGYSNTVDGAYALKASTSGYSNTAIGYNALTSNTTGIQNTAVGRNAGFDCNSITGLGNNTFIGYNTGRGITTGTNNTIIGASATGLAAALSNTVIIADGAGNQRIFVDASANMGIGTSAPSYKLHVAGSVAGTSWTVTSDKRFKKDIASIPTGMDVINQLRGVSYNWNELGKQHGGDIDKKQYGFIAQEVEALLPDIVNTDKEGYKSIEYIKVIPFLTKAAQEEHQKIQKLEEMIQQQQISIQTLQNELKQLKQKVK